MAHYKFKFITLFILLSIGILGCEMTQEVDLPAHEPKLALRLALANVDTLKESSTLYKYSHLFVGRSQSILFPDESLAGMANAIVKLYDESGAVVEEYMHTGKAETEYGYNVEMQGYYIPTQNFIPEPGKTYTLRASAYGYPDVEATTTMPVPPAVADLAFKGELSPTQSYVMEGNLTVEIAEKPGGKNYYRIVAIPMDSAYTRFSNYPAYSIDAYDGTDLENNEKPRLGEVFSNELYTSGKLTFSSHISFPSVDFYTYQNGKKNYARHLEVQVQQLTEEEYLFAKTLESQWRSDDNPFAEHQNVYSNVRNGYGVLGSVTVSRFVVDVQ